MAKIPIIFEFWCFSKHGLCTCTAWQPFVIGWQEKFRYWECSGVSVASPSSVLPVLRTWPICLEPESFYQDFEVTCVHINVWTGLFQVIFLRNRFKHCVHPTGSYLKTFGNKRICRCPTLAFDRQTPMYPSKPCSTSPSWLYLSWAFQIITLSSSLFHHI